MNIVFRIEYFGFGEMPNVISWKDPNISIQAFGPVQLGNKSYMKDNIRCDNNRYYIDENGKSLPEYPKIFKLTKVEPTDDQKLSMILCKKYHDTGKATKMFNMIQTDCAR